MREESYEIINDSAWSTEYQLRLPSSSPGRFPTTRWSTTAHTYLFVIGTLLTRSHQSGRCPGFLPHRLGKVHCEMEVVMLSLFYNRKMGITTWTKECFDRGLMNSGRSVRSLSCIGFQWSLGVICSLSRRRCAAIESLVRSGLLVWC